MFRPHPEKPDEMVQVVFVEFVDPEIVRLLRRAVRILGRIEDELLPPKPPPPTSITFKEISMLPPIAGNTLVYTGVLAPAGAQFPTDSVFAATSSDPTVSPSVDSTGLIVTIPLPTGFVDDPANPLTVSYTATSASASMSLSASIQPTIPPVTPTGITFTQTT